MNKLKIILFSVFLLCSSCSNNVAPKTLPDDFLIIAHRGASYYAPQHTFAAYELANNMNATYIELDLQMTKDKKLVAFHDSKITLRDEHYFIRELMLEEVKKFKPGVYFNKHNPLYASVAFESLEVLELSEILEHFEDDVNYYIELKFPSKTPGIEEELIRQLQQFNLLHHPDPIPKVIVQSFDQTSLQKIFELDSTIPLIQLYGKNTKTLATQKMKEIRTYASGVGMDKRNITPTLIKDLQKHQLHIHPFVSNDYEEMQQFINDGVNGIFTDRPDLLVKAILSTK